MTLAKYLRILLCVAAVISGVPVAIPQGLPFPGPGFRTLSGGAPIGTPAGIGNNNNTASSSSMTITTTANIVSGDLVFILINSYSGSSAVTVSSVSDGTNTYAKAVGAQEGGVFDSEIWYKGNAAAVSSGATITINFSGTVGTKWASASRVTGIIATPLDATSSSSSASTTAPSVTSGVLAQTNEIVIGTVSFVGGATVTEDAAFTLLTNYSWGDINHLAYKIVSATTSVTYAPTLGSASEEIALIATFKGN